MASGTLTQTECPYLSLNDPRKSGSAQVQGSEWTGADLRGRRLTEREGQLCRRVPAQTLQLGVPCSSAPLVRLATGLVAFHPLARSRTSA